MLIVADTTTEAIGAVSSNRSTKTTINPAAPPQDGTCHFMRLPPELRLFIYEDVFQDFFSRLTARLNPQLVLLQNDWLPEIQELLSMLHVSRTFRTEVIDVYSQLAEDASRLVDSRSSYAARCAINLPVRPFNKIERRQNNIRKILRKIKRSITNG